MPDRDAEGVFYVHAAFLYEEGAKDKEAGKHMPNRQLTEVPRCPPHPCPDMGRLAGCLGPSGRDLATASPPSPSPTRPQLNGRRDSCTISGSVRLPPPSCSHVKNLAQCIRIVHDVFHDEVSSRMRRRPRRELFVTFLHRCSLAAFVCF